MSTPSTTSLRTGGPVLEEVLRCLVVMVVRLPRGDVLGEWHRPARAV
ncbi:hypothetical protein [Streptomyces sp. NPDC059468]